MGTGALCLTLLLEGKQQLDVGNLQHFMMCCDNFLGFFFFVGLGLFRVLGVLDFFLLVYLFFGAFLWVDLFLVGLFVGFFCVSLFVFGHFFPLIGQLSLCSSSGMATNGGSLWLHTKPSLFFTFLNLN